MHKPAEPSQESLQAGYETSDIHVKLIVVTVAGLFILLFAGIIFGVIYLRYMEESTVPHTNKPTHPMYGTVQFDAPWPPLQMDPVVDRRGHIGAEKKRLNSYGQVTVTDDEGNVEHVVHAHIPIERAMELVASGKAPYRQEPRIALESEEDDIFGEDTPSAEGN